MEKKIKAIIEAEFKKLPNRLDLLCRLEKNKEEEEKLFGMAYRIMKAVYWNYKEKLILLEEKLDTQKLESKNKIKEYGPRIELIRDESKIEREEINTEKMNKLIKITRIKEDMKKTRVRIISYKELIDFY